MRLSIGTKLIASFLVIIGLVTAFGVYSMAISRKALQEAVGQSSVFLVEDIIEKIDKDIFLKVDETQIFSKDLFMQKALLQSNQAFEGLNSIRIQEYISRNDSEWVLAPKDVITPFMRELIDSELSNVLREEFIVFREKKYGYRVYGEAFITNKYGANIAQTGKTSDYYQADEEWWQQARANGFFVGEVEYDQSAGEWSMPIGVRIDDKEGNFIGVIKVIPIAREMIREIDLNAKKYQTTEIRLLAEEGRLIYATKAFQVFEDISGKEFFKHITKGSGFFIAKEGEREKLFAYAHSKGFRDFKGLQWIVLIGHDTAEVFGKIDKLRQTVVIASGFLFLLVSFLAIVLTRAISRPIKKLTEGAHYIAQGNLDVKIDLKTKDEIAELATAFNEMTSQLKESYRGLERKVKERTGELEERIYELDKTAKMLVRRDTELSHTRETLQGQIGEMDKISKRLVRRDFDLLQANEILREIDEAKSRFVSIAAHQLRTPLAGVKWTVQMFLSGDFGKITKGQKDAFNAALLTLGHLAKLIDDLLNVARIESGQFAFVFSSVNIEEACRKTLNESAAEAKNRGISISLHVPSEPLPRVYGDFGNLVVVLQNIVENAIAYTPKGGAIDLTIEKDPRDLKMVRISVKDTGMGIPDEQKGLVGQKFFRADNVVREQIPGTGLGLYIAQRILEQHKGALQIESEKGRGSTFSFTLPFVENSDMVKARG